MLLALFLILCMGICPVQLFLLFGKKPFLVRYIPTLVLLAMIVGCWIMTVYPTGIFSGEDGRLAAIIAMCIGCGALALDVFAWMIWGIVKLIQKLQK